MAASDAGKIEQRNLEEEMEQSVSESSETKEDNAVSKEPETKDQSEVPETPAEDQKEGGPLVEEKSTSDEKDSSVQAQESLETPSEVCANNLDSEKDSSDIADTGKIVDDIGSEKPESCDTTQNPGSDNIENQVSEQVTQNEKVSEDDGQSNNQEKAVLNIEENSTAIENDQQSEKKQDLEITDCEKIISTPPDEKHELKEDNISVSNNDEECESKEDNSCKDSDAKADTGSRNSLENEEILNKDVALRMEDSIPFVSENSNSSIPERLLPASVVDTLDASMDAYTESERSETPMFDTPGPATPASSIMDVGPTPSKRSRQNSTGSSANVDTGIDEFEKFPASKLFEYQWPLDNSGEYYMLQEQVSEFLGVKSFKRKYPELQRRAVDMHERVFLREKGAVTETQCDLGLTSLKSEEVHDLMHRDYPDKYQEYASVLHERERQTMKEKHKEYGVPKFEKSKMTEYLKKAVKSASEWNSMFLREKKEERRAYFDLQTFNVHYPRKKFKTLPQDATLPSPYPVTLIPGQFQDYYKPYSEDELKYLPLNTAMYNPPKVIGNKLANPSEPLSEEENSGEDTEEKSDSESEDESSSDSGDSSGQDNTAAVDDNTDKNQDSDEVKCRICTLATSKTENLVQCSECKQHGHPSCLDLTMDMVSVINTYPWQCMECKTCVECMDPYDEDKMMFCDRCDRGYHTFCVGVKSIPTGRWKCRSCKTPDTPKTPRSASKVRGRGRKRGGNTPTVDS